MHQCEEFRERITERIIDREDLTRRSEIQSELLLCQSCSDFYSESAEMMEALSAVEFQVAEEHWDAMTHRLRMRIINERIVLSAAPPRRRSRWLAWDFGVPAIAAIAAVMLVTVGLYRLAAPLVERPRTALLTSEQLLEDQIANLDPVTVDFLEQSELLLRNVMKLEATDTEDLQEARQLAMQHLIRIDQRMQAASNAPPVQTLMSKYETILRDIRHLSRETAAEDIIDIQSRIEKNGLIADIKAFQPTVTVVDVDIDEQ